MKVYWGLQRLSDLENKSWIPRFGAEDISSSGSERGRSGYSSIIDNSLRDTTDWQRDYFLTLLASLNLPQAYFLERSSCTSCEELVTLIPEIASALR